MPRCRHCKEKFEPRFKTTEPYCWNEECKEVEIRLYLDNKKKKKDKDWKKEKKVIKERLKTHSEHEKDLQSLINQIINLIDKGQPCMSCSNKGKPQAGHYHSTGANNSIRFNLNNIWNQCYRCNVQLSANIIGYDEGLIETYGKNFWEEIKFGLVRKYPLIKLSKEEINEKKYI